MKSVRSRRLAAGIAAATLGVAAGGAQAMTVDAAASGPVSNDVIVVTTDETPDWAGAHDPARFVLSSKTDPAYAGGVPAIAAGVHVRFADFAGDKPLHTSRIHVRFREPLDNGHTYTLAVKGLKGQGGASTDAAITFTSDDVVRESRAIKVNQVGYLPGRPKVGYVGDYLGDLGGAVWAVGDGGGIARWDQAKGWAKVPSPFTGRLSGVAATTEDLAFAVGEGGAILRWDGEAWTEAASPTSADLSDAAFGPTREAWAVGAGGTILRWGGGAWEQVPSPTTATLRSVWAGATEAFAVGDGGVILRYDGAAWKQETSPVTADLLALATTTPGQQWAVGAGGTVVVRQWGIWKTWTNKPGGSQTLRGVAANGSGSVWVTGDGGVLWKKDQLDDGPFNALGSGTSQDMRTLARLDERRLFAAGAGGASARSEGKGAWVSDSLPLGTVNDVAALPYGALRLPEPLPMATVMDAETGEAVFAAPLELRAANWALSGEDVYRFDFSAVTTEGAYRIYVPGVGVSDRFRIAEDALDEVAYTTARGLYYQRCGVALEAPYADAGYERGLCHGKEHDAAYHESLPNTPLYGGEQVGETIDATGGWHDAGDFGKYMPTGVAALWFLFEGYELDPTRFQDGAWNIPESGNGVPDLLDEARVQLEWMLKIQRGDGAFPHKVTAACWFNGMPETEDEQRYVYESTTHDTATGAAVFASASRLFEELDPDFATTLLERAELAWGFIGAHPDMLPAQPYKNAPGNCTGAYPEPDDVDNRMWAAAELWRATGDANYRQAFEGWWAKHGTEWGWNDWQHHYRKAYWAYLRAERDDGDPAIVASIRNGFLVEADEIMGYTQANPYMNGSRLDVPIWIGWGVFTMGPKAAFPLLQAFALTGDESYRDAAVLNADAQLGTNPLAMSFITGVGARYPNNPLDMESEYDGVEAPVPGLPVFGPHHHQSPTNKFQKMTQEDASNYPWCEQTEDPLPILRRYNDAFELPMMAEFTVLEQALTTVTFHLLTGASSPMPPEEVACGGVGACDDGDPCTTDACDPVAGCVATPNTAPCDDGDPCTVQDQCSGGVCGGQPVPCEGGVPTEIPETPGAGRGGEGGATGGGGSGGEPGAGGSGGEPGAGGETGEPGAGGGVSSGAGAGVPTGGAGAPAGGGGAPTGGSGGTAGGEGQGAGGELAGPGPEAEAGASSAGDDGGCSATGRAASGAAGWALALFALVALRRRVAP